MFASDFLVDLKNFLSTHKIIMKIFNFNQMIDEVLVCS